ncbi:hypothetical protein BBJ28_00007376 [Nothophytophthora sp. Chile5]|nr:hypothetical protein BBJ28_00007376 [Nothophytophthora sp. Chile5]
MSSHGPSSRVAVDLGETESAHNNALPARPSRAGSETGRARPGRSYWRRRYDQWVRNSDSQPDRLSRKAFAPGTIAMLPLEMQIAFRRKMLFIFALQLLLLTILVTVLTYESTLSQFTTDAFKSTTDLVGPLIGSVVALGAVYFVRTRFPLNWLMVAAFTVVLSLLVAAVQTWLDTPAGLFCCGFTFVAVCIMMLLSSLTYRYRESTATTDPEAGQQVNRDGQVVLRSSLFAGCVAFTVSAVLAGVLFAILGGDGGGFVTLQALGYSLLLELVLITWFSYDASSMYSVLTPDEYMSGVVYFYVDLIVLTCAAFMFAGVVFMAALFCPTAGFGYCNCNGCLCFSRARTNDDDNDNDDAGIIPFSANNPPEEIVPPPEQA